MGLLHTSISVHQPTPYVAQTRTKYSTQTQQTPPWQIFSIILSPLMRKNSLYFELGCIPRNVQELLKMSMNLFTSQKMFVREKNMFVQLKNVRTIVESKKSS
jgi:hypothetical protein